MRLFCTLLLLATFVSAQTAPKPSQLPSAPAGSTQEPNAAKEASDVAPTAPVITLNGFCPGKQETGPACKTEISREQFEKLADALHVPDNRKPELANAYAQMLVLGGTAEERGLANAPDNQQILKFVRLQTLSQLLARDLREKAANIPDAEIQSYYDQHKAQFAQATIERIFIPKTAANAKEKPSDAALKAEADKIEAAAKAAGADFAKLQKEVYTDLKLTSTPPPVELRDMRRDSLPPDQQAKVFDLAPGSVTEPIDEPAAIYIYKVVSKDTPPLTQVQAEAKRDLEQQRFQAEMEKIVGSVKPELNNAYFAAAAANAPAPPTLGRPTVPEGTGPASKHPAPAPRTPAAPPSPK